MVFAYKLLFMMFWNDFNNKHV